jgi:hypothetical protein
MPGKIFPMEKQGKGAPVAKPDRFAWMLEESKKLSTLIKVPDQIILEIFRCASDWEFILKIDALLEAAVRKVLKVALTPNDKIDTETVEDFVDTLPMRGRTSLLALLKGTGCDETDIQLIDCVRRLRNGFAHDITQVSAKLIEIIKQRGDRLELLKALSYVEKFDADTLTKMFEEDSSFLRFTILTGTLTFLIVAYHNVIKEKESAAALVLANDGQKSF